MSNKEFYVRHGLVVNNTVLTANVITNKVGIGTNNAAYTLDVIGNANISQPSLFVAGTNVLATLNSAYTITNAAYDSANSNWAVQNSLYTLANTIYDSANSNWTVQNAIYDLTNTVYNSSNSNWVVQNAVYETVNSSYIMGNAAYTTLNAAYTMANAGYTTINAAYDSANSNWTVQNLVYATVNASYTLANAAYANANSLAIGANTWANTVGEAGNNYASILAANNALAGNNYTNTVGAAGNNYASILAANNAIGANTWANTKLANTNNVWTAGSLNIAQDLFVNRNITNVTQLIFNTGTNITPTTPGALTWSQDDSTLHFDMDTPSNVIQHIGQDTFYLVKNQTGETISKGTVVRFAGTLGASGRLLISKATANNSIPSKYVMGVAAADIGNGADGFVYSFGKLRGINTSMFSAGDILYLSSSVPGGLSNTMPTAPNNKVTVAAVVHSDAAVGSIAIRLTYGSRLNENENAEVNGVANGDVLRYNSANSRFENFNENAIGPAINAAAAFAHSNSVAIAANAWSNTVGIAGNNYTNTVGLSGNNYAGFMVNSSNSYADSTYLKLTSPSQTITGDLSITGNVFLLGNATSISTNNVVINDSLIYLAANNYQSDILDIGFVGHYSNGTANLHTGLFRDHDTKQYFLFNDLGGPEPSTINDLVPYANGMINAVLHADIITSNIVLGGANAIHTISGAFDKANAAYNNANVGFAAANAYSDSVGLAGNNYTNAVGTAGNNYMLYVTTSGNTYAGYMANSANAYAYDVGVAGNNVTYAVGLAGNSYTQQVGTAGNNYTNAVGLAGNNYASILVANNAVGANNWANTVGIAGNNYTNSVGIAGNNYTNAVGVAGNNYTNTTGLAGNNYTNAVGVAGNSYTQQVGIAGNNYTNYVGASANTYATATYATLSNVAIVYNTSNVAFDTANAAFAVANNVAPQIAPSYNTANAAYLNSNAAYDLANAAFNAQNTDYNTSNSAYVVANSAFDVANAAFASANNVSPQVTPSYNTANAAYLNSNAAFDKANSANVLAFNTGIGANAWTNTVSTAGNNYTNSVGLAGNNYTNSVGTSGNSYALTTATDIGNAGNNYMLSVATAGNNYTDAVGTAGNNYTNSVGTSGNNYTNSVGDASNNYSSILAANNALAGNNYTNSVGLAGNNYTNTVGIAGNSYAEQVGTAANTFADATYYKKTGGLISGDVGISGNLTISGTTTFANTQQLQVGDNIVTLNADLPLSTPPVDNAGIEVNRGSLNSNAALLWIESTGQWSITGNNAQTISSFIASNTIVEQAAAAGNAYASILAANNAVGANAWSNTVGTAGNNYTNSVGLAGNNYMLSVATAGNNYIDVSLTATNNYTNYVGTSANSYSNSLFTTANNNINSLAVGANAWASAVGTAGNNYTNSVATAGNNYAVSLVTAANNWANTKVDSITSNGARIWANSSVTAGIEVVNIDLATTGVSAGVYGNSTIIPIVTVDAYGRVTSISNVATVGGGASVNVGATAPGSPTVGNLWWDTNSARMYIYYTDADSSQWVDASPTGSYALPNTYVTPATYGGATQIPVITIDGQGRINVAANVAVQGMDYAYANTRVASVTSNSNSRIWANTITDGSSSKNVFIDLATSGVTAASYGSSTNIPVITVDAYGRVTYAANIAVQGMDYAYANNIANSTNAWANTKTSGGAYVGNNGQLGSGFGDIFRVHSNTLSTNAYVNTGNNAIAAGPITISVGQTLTINAGASVVIV